MTVDGRPPQPISITEVPGLKRSAGARCNHAIENQGKQRVRPVTNELAVRKNLTIFA
jgi:hypothetical protein